jgi:hypothetical protein
VPRLTFLLAATLLTLAIPGTAQAATPVGDAVAGLRANHLYVDPSATTRLDQAAVRAAIGDAPIRIAILAPGPGVTTVRQWPRAIADQLPGNTIATISGRYFYAGSDILAAGAAGLAATHAIAKHKDVLRENASSDVTAALLDFIAEVKAAPRAPATVDGRADRYADEPGGGTADDSEDTGILPWIVGGALLAAIAALGGVVEARRRAAGRIRQRRTETHELLDRLAGELDPGVPALKTTSTDGAGLPDWQAVDVDGSGAPAWKERAAAPADGSGPDWPTGQAGLAFADAAARYGTAQALLIAASTGQQVDQARHVILEGLIAARTARGLLGKEPGPAVPPFDPPAPKVRTDTAEPVAAGATRLSPDPEYAPRTPYFHAGGYGVPAGWYPVRIPDTGSFTVPDSLPSEPTGTSHGNR